MKSRIHLSLDSIANTTFRRILDGTNAQHLGEVVLPGRSSSVTGLVRAQKFNGLRPWPCVRSLDPLLSSVVQKSCNHAAEAPAAEVTRRSSLAFTACSRAGSKVCLSRKLESGSIPDLSVSSESNIAPNSSIRKEHTKKEAMIIIGSRYWPLIMRICAPRPTAPQPMLPPGSGECPLSSVQRCQINTQGFHSDVPHSGCKWAGLEEPTYMDQRSPALP